MIGLPWVELRQRMNQVRKFKDNSTRSVLCLAVFSSGAHKGTSGGQIF